MAGKSRENIEEPLVFTDITLRTTSTQTRMHYNLVYTKQVIHSCYMEEIHMYNQQVLTHDT